MNKLLRSFLALLLIGWAATATAGVTTEEGAGFTILRSSTGQCLLVVASTDVAATACQPGALLYRTDSKTFYNLQSGSWAVADLTSDALIADSLAVTAAITGADITASDDLTTLDLIVTGTMTLADGIIARADLTEDALAIYGISIEELRSDAGASLTAAETAGTFNIAVGTNTILANAEVTDNETEVSVAYFQFTLPPEYVAAGDVTLRMPCALITTATAVDNGSTLDVAVYEQADAGTVGSDLSTTTAAATFAAIDTWYNKDFVITAAGLVAGDVLNVKITASVIDSEAGAGTIILNLAPPKFLIDIKG